MNLIEIETGIYIDPKLIIELDVKIWAERGKTPTESAIVKMTRNKQNLSTRFHITGLKIKEITSNPSFCLPFKEEKRTERSHITEVHLIYK